MNDIHPPPAPDLLALDRLVGTWQVSGDASGQVRYEWAEGGYFLIQHFDLNHAGHPNRGLEVIGHLHPFQGKPSPDIHTRVYSYVDGLTLDYVYELAGDTLTIWGDHRGSAAFYRGEFSADGQSVTGGWQWPGGGYTSNMTRLPADAWPPRGLSAPARRALAGAGIANTQQLAAHTEKEVLVLHGLGRGALGPLREALAASGLRFAPPQERT